MIKSKVSVIVTLFLIVIFAVPATAMTSANYQVEPTTISSGGGTCASSCFILNSSIGPYSPVGISTSATCSNMAGYWYLLEKIIAGGDINGNGNIDLQDAILVLQILSNLPSDGYEKDADVNEDGVIGVQEAVYILQKVGLLRDP